MRKLITRDDLFNQVWSNPMTKVANDYGLSDVGLKKICKRHKIPVPGRGYWAKVVHDKNVQVKTLSTQNDPKLEKIAIYASAKSRLSPEVQQRIEEVTWRENQPENKINLSSSPNESHPVVLRMKKKLDSKKPDNNNLINSKAPDLISCSISVESKFRLFSFLNTFLFAMESRGHKIEAGKISVAININGERLPIKITEQTAQPLHGVSSTSLQFKPNGNLVFHIDE